MSRSNESTLEWLSLMDNINAPSSYSSSLDDQRTDDQQPDNSHVEEQRNSLLRLNDYCLRDIFASLNRGTLCQLADVCTRLRSIAEKVFSKKHTEVVLSKEKYESILKYEALFRLILYKFGQLITSIDFHYYCSLEEINAIAKYCPNLEIFGIKLMDDPEIHPNLFPKLVELKLTFWPTRCVGLDAFRKLISLSPQLKRLQIINFIRDDYIAAIIQHAKNLEELDITMPYWRPAVQLTKERLLQLIELKKFHIRLFEKINFVASLMTAFSMQNINLNSLHLENVSIDSNDIKSIFNFKKLEYLYLGNIKSSDEIISLVNELSLLRTLGLKFKPFSALSLVDLINMVKAGKQLQEITLIPKRKIKIDRKVVGEFLGAVSNRLNQETLTIKLSDYKMDTLQEIWDTKLIKLLIY